MNNWIDRAEALAALGVKPQTLYAYVSRGRIEMRPDPDDSRRSLYRSEDVQALINRRVRGRRSAAIAASTIAWGEPVISTEVATIHHGKIYYRGQDAVVFSTFATLEATAALLWNASQPADFSDLEQASEGSFLCLARLAHDGPHLLGRTPDRWHSDASGVIGKLATSLGAMPGHEPVHERLGRGWSVSTEGQDRIRRALVLMADHELNPSTFAVRVAASTGPSIAASLLAGLCALSGPLHGHASTALLALLDEASRAGFDETVNIWLARHHSLPGFGHPLYPAGDPRSFAIINGLDVDERLDMLRESIFRLTGALPNLDFALAALILTYDLPRDAGFKLFALARSVGWAAHAMEQVAIGQIIRPRARYVGKLDEASNG